MKTITTNNAVLYRQLLKQLQKQIKNGQITGKLPSIAKLTKQYNVSHNTIKKVLDCLKEQKYLYGHQGKGVYVNNIALNSPIFQKHIVFYLHIETYRNPFYLHVVSILRGLLEKEESIVHFVNSPQQLMNIPECVDVLLMVGIVNKQEAVELQSIVTKEKIIQLNESCGDYHVITTDNITGGYMAIDYLYRHGHRKVGLISRDLNMESVFMDRYKGVMQYSIEHSDLKIFNSEITISPTNMDQQTAGIATEKLFEQHPGITAIFAFTDILAMGVIAFCQKNDINIPQDVSLIGFDNRDFAPMLSPPLTTIQENVNELANQAMVNIRNILAGNHGFETGKVMPFLIERNSVKNCYGKDNNE